MLVLKMSDSNQKSYNIDYIGLLISIKKYYYLSYQYQNIDIEKIVKIEKFVEMKVNGV